VNRSTKRRLACPMDVGSPLPSVPRVAFLLRRQGPKYRESLLIQRPFERIVVKSVKRVVLPIVCAFLDSRYEDVFLPLVGVPVRKEEQRRIRYG